MNNEKRLSIIGIIIKLGVAIPALLFSFLVMTSGVNMDSDKLVRDAYMNDVWFNSVVHLCLYGILVAVVLILVFYLLLLVTRPVEAIKSILGLILTAVLFFILYSIGTADTLESLKVQTDISITEGEMNFTHAGIYTTFILLGVCSALALLMGFVMKFIKN